MAVCTVHLTSLGDSSGENDEGSSFTKTSGEKIKSAWVSLQQGRVIVRYRLALKTAPEGELACEL